MIKDSIQNSNLYYNLSENIRLGLEFLENTDLQKLENGRYPIKDNEVYVNIQDYDSKAPECCKFEVHRKYIDIQHVITGKEIIRTGDINDFVTDIEYNADKDIEFLNKNNNSITTQDMSVSAGEFLILFPQEVHMPCIAIEQSEYVKKAVVKVISA